MTARVADRRRETARHTRESGRLTPTEAGRPPRKCPSVGTERPYGFRRETLAGLYGDGVTRRPRGGRRNNGLTTTASYANPTLRVVGRAISSRFHVRHKRATECRASRACRRDGRTEKNRPDDGVSSSRARKSRENPRRPNAWRTVARSDVGVNGKTFVAVRPPPPPPRSSPHSWDPSVRSFSDFATTRTRNSGAAHGRPQTVPQPPAACSYVKRECVLYRLMRCEFPIGIFSAKNEFDRTSS